MKIALLNIYQGLVGRGAETHVKEVAQRLADKNEVVVYQAEDKEGFEKYRVETIPIGFNWKKKSGAGTLAARFFIDYWNRLIFIFTLKAIPKVWKEKYDVVIPVNGGWMPALLRIVTWLYGGKMVISGQSGKGWDDRNNLWCFPNTFVALSADAKKWAGRANPFVKTIRIPNGVDLKKFKPDGPKMNVDLPRPIILCVGALTKSKRIDLTVRAVAKIKDASLLIVGDGDLKSEISRLGSELLGKRFKLIKVPFEKMPNVYRVADVFTLASESYYSFEIVLVEAMASGLAVVANKDDIRREIIGRAGVLVDPTNTDAYTVALENALRIKWGRRPQNQARKFDWDKIALKYEELFGSLLK